jgi:hypothetical protein
MSDIPEPLSNRRYTYLWALMIFTSVFTGWCIHMAIQMHAESETVLLGLFVGLAGMNLYTAFSMGVSVRRQQFLRFLKEHQHETSS